MRRGGFKPLPNRSPTRSVQIVLVQLSAKRAPHSSAPAPAEGCVSRFFPLFLPWGSAAKRISDVAKMPFVRGRGSRIHSSVERSGSTRRRVDHQLQSRIVVGLKGGEVIGERSLARMHDLLAARTGLADVVRLPPAVEFGTALP